MALIVARARPTGLLVPGWVPPMVLDWHAAFTGGALPAAATPWQRLAYRSGCVHTLRACVVDADGAWTGSQLYHGLESTEKAQASYRVGTALAGVAAQGVLGLPLLVHRETLLGKSAGPRGDLLGLRTGALTWHGIEAKGKSPDPASGGYRRVSNPAFAKAKGQALSLRNDLLAEGAATGTDHWSATTLTSTSAVTEVVLEDPSSDSSGGPPAGPGADADFDDEDPNERLLQGFFQVAGDIALLAEGSAQDEPPVESDLPGRFRGVRLPEFGLWFGVSWDILMARQEHRLTDIIGDVLASEEAYSGGREVLSAGLALARLTDS